MYMYMYIHVYGLKPAFNPLPTIGNSLKKQKLLYKLLTPSIKPPIYGLMGAHDAYMRHWLVKG